MAGDGLQVMVIEDNREYRDILVLMLQGQSDITLSGQFATSEVAIGRLAQQPLEEQPNVILLDLRLPGQDGLDALPEIRKAAPSARVLVLTQSEQEKDVLRAIRRGASGYLLKSSTARDLLAGIRNVHDGKAALDPVMAKYILESVREPASDDGSSAQSLSERETEVLKLIAEGLVKKEVAKRLDIGYTTVDTYVSRIYAKLNVNNAPAAVHEAHRRKLFDD